MREISQGEKQNSTKQKNWWGKYFKTWFIVPLPLFPKLCWIERQANLQIFIKGTHLAYNDAHFFISSTFKWGQAHTLYQSQICYCWIGENNEKWKTNWQMQSFVQKAVIIHAISLCYATKNLSTPWNTPLEFVIYLMDGIWGSFRSDRIHNSELGGKGLK